MSLSWVQNEEICFQIVWIDHWASRDNRWPTQGNVNNHNASWSSVTPVMSRIILKMDGCLELKQSNHEFYTFTRRWITKCGTFRGFLTFSTEEGTKQKKKKDWIHWYAAWEGGSLGSWCVEASQSLVIFQLFFFWNFNLIVILILPASNKFFCTLNSLKGISSSELHSWIVVSPENGIISYIGCWTHFHQFWAESSV